MARLPQRAGLSLHPQHFQEIVETRPSVGWFEIHPEHYLGMGGEAHYYLEKIAAYYPISMNSSCLSIGSAESVSAEHLQSVQALIDRYRPAQFSEHLSWSRWQGGFFSELLPIPYTLEALDQVSINIKDVQNKLGRRILVENPSSYITLTDTDLQEGPFFEELVRSTGCGLLLDINNLYTSSQNTGRNPYKDLESFPVAAIQEIHLGGHSLHPLDQDNMLLVNDCSNEISKPVWQLYREVLSLLPMPVATLIEWDASTPSLFSMIELAQKTEQIMNDIFPGLIKG